MLDPDRIDDLTVVVYPHPALRAEAGDIDSIDADIEKLARKMIELMHACRGVGLAANQVGIPLRLFVANPGGEEGEDRVFINPQIIDESGWVEHEEGCLSLPQIYAPIRRREKCVIEALDLSGKAIRQSAEGLLARIFQHETDHLAGRLILNRMSAVSRMSARRQLRYLEEQAKSDKTNVR